MNVAEYTESTTNQRGHREPHKPPIWLFWRARRYVVIVYMFFGLANSYAMRANMSIAIVAMTRYENVTSENGTSFMGLMMPTLSPLWAKWTPLTERNRLVSLTVSGNYFGMVVSSTLSSLVCSTFGWESIFYLFGVLGALWTILWLIFVANSPDTDHRITKEELDYIAVSLKSVTNEKTGKIPWLAVFTSLPVWALMFATGGEYWGFNTLLAYMPMFMNYILNFDLNKTGLMTSLPYVLLVIIMQVSSYVCDYVTKHELMSLTKLRKLSIATGFLFQFTFLLLAVHVLSPISSTICLLLAVGIGGVALSTLSINVLDLSPRFASLIVGIINSLAILPGIISPTITGYIITDETDVYQWRIVFYISAAFYLLGFIMFTIFGSGELQPWNDPEYSRARKENEIVT